MQLPPKSWQLSHIDLLMNASAVLSELCGSLKLAEQIPAHLAHLQGGRVSFAVIATSRDGKSFLLKASSAPFEGEELQSQLLLAASPRERSVAAPLGVDWLATTSAAAIHGVSNGEVVFVRRIDDAHELVVILHDAVQEGDAALASMMPLIVDHLARLLLPLVIWYTRPQLLGERFSRLTRREWAVLRGLSSESGEKQLADELGMSPHTLHSHIKSIYRKVGVQGRLQLLGLVQGALRQLRTGILHEEGRIATAHA